MGRPRRRCSASGQLALALALVSALADSSCAQENTRNGRALVADVSGSGNGGGQGPTVVHQAWRKKAGGHKFMPGQLALLRKWRLQQVQAERQRQQQLQRRMQNGLTTPWAPLCSCNYRPREECDFHFLGFAQQVPIIHVAGTNENLAMTPPLKAYRRGDAASVRVLEVGTMRAQTCLGVALGVSSQAHEQTSRMLQAALRFPLLQQSRMFRRSMSRDDMRALDNVCVKVPLARVEILDPNGGVVQLWKGDGNKAFPLSRRCIAFKFAV